jgi:hypothetical protein
MSSAPTTWASHYRGTPSFSAATRIATFDTDLRDVVVRGHGHRLAKRDHPALEELVVVGGEGIGHKILADVAVRGLVEIGVGRLSLAAYVGGPGPGTRRSPPEGAKVAYAPVWAMMARLAEGARLASREFC